MRKDEGSRAIIILACDLWDKGAVLGPETRARCERGLEELAKYPGSRFVLMAGMADRKKYPRQTQTMAEMMKSYLVNRGVPEQSITVPVVRDIWGSEAELSKSLHWIFLRHDQFGTCTDDQRIIDVSIISSDYHLRRLRLIVDSLMKHFGVPGVEWNFNFLDVEGEDRNRRIEYFKYPIYALLRLFSRNK